LPVTPKAITTAQSKICDRDESRTAILIANTSTVQTAYIKSTSGVTTSNGFPVYPETYVLLSFDEGCEVEKELYAIGDGSLTLIIWEHHRKLGGTPPPPTPPPYLQADPPM